MDWKMGYMGKVRLGLINRWANGFDLRALDLAHRIETHLPDADGAIRSSVPLLDLTDPSLSSDKPRSRRVSVSQFLFQQLRFCGRSSSSRSRTVREPFAPVCSVSTPRAPRASLITAFDESQYISTSARLIGVTIESRFPRF
jgi:hypothetical protein